MQVPLEHGLDVIRDAVWRMAKNNLHTMDPHEGSVPVFFPGPVLHYKRQNGGYVVAVWTNGGREHQAQQLSKYLMLYAGRR